MKTRLIAGALACIIAATLAACGGGGGGGGTAAESGPPSVPASAFASVDSFVAYLQQLVASTSETSEPLTLPEGTAAPTTETSEPTPAG